MSDLVSRLNAALQGRYRVERKLGEGGMATVYLAEDLRHDRRVAIKVLRPELAAVVGAERFLAEIKTTAALQHPHILPLHDSGEADGFLFYVMPYVEGESLRERLDRERQLPVDEAVEIARKVADALDYAHERGVVHRDVKPGNVLLSDRGEPLVADFGIALAVSQAGGGRITETGLSLGTPHYMSPEQASGEQTVDRRTDVYALGCVLYEMLAGEPPYGGPTAQAVLARILTAEARPLTESRATVPSHVEAVVARALEKLPADRFGSAEAFGEALRDTSFRHGPGGRGTSAGSGRPGGPARPRWPASRTERMAAGGLAILVLALLTIGGLALFGPGGPGGGREAALEMPPTSRFLVELEHPVSGGELDLSPDGSLLVYAPEDENEPLYLRRLDELEARPVPGTEGADWPVFSPDGRWIAFRDRDDDIRKMAVTGGSPLRVAVDLQVPFSLHWGDDGTIVFAQRDGIYRVSAQGGEPERLLEGGTFSLRFPRLLPGSEGLLFSDLEGLGSDRREVRLLDIASGEVTTLVEEGADARYVATGHLLYGHPRGSLFAVPFDLEGREVTGDPFPAQDGVRVHPGVTAAAFAASRVGTVAYLRGEGSVLRSALVLVDTAGAAEPLPLESPLLYAPRFAPDGTRLAYEDERQIYVYDLVVGTNTRITFDGLHELPVWTPEGDSIVFGSEGDGSEGSGLFWAPADGEGEPALLWAEDGGQFPESWDPGGRRLLYTSVSVEGNHDLKVLDLDAGPEAAPYLDADWDEYRGRISPDGRWVAYESDEDGTNAVYVRAFPEPGPKTRISEGGGESSRWSPDGRALYYWRGDTLVAAQLRTEPAFGVLSRSDVLVGDYDEEYDVRPDGAGFVFSRQVAPDPPAGDAGEAVEDATALVVVVNWFEELMRRAGRPGGNP